MTIIENNPELMAEDRNDEENYEGAQTPLRRFLSDFCEARLAVFGFFIILVIALVAIMAPFIAPTDPCNLATVSILDSRLEPGEAMMSGTIAYLGTDGALYRTEFVADMNGYRTRSNFCMTAK